MTESALTHRAIDVDSRADVEALLFSDAGDGGQRGVVGVNDQDSWLDVHVPPS